VALYETRSNHDLQDAKAEYSALIELADIDRAFMDNLLQMQKSNQEWRTKELANIRASATEKAAVRRAFYVDLVTKGTRPPTSVVILAPLDLLSAGGAGSDNNDDDTYGMDDEDDVDNDEDDDSTSTDDVSI
jgi:hypothetical protein